MTPETITTEQLLAATGYSRAYISEMKGKGLITPSAKGEWPAVKTLSTMVSKLREKQAAFSSEATDKKKRFEADTAELEFLRAAGETVSIEHANEFWADARIEIRQTIERADYMDDAQKTRLLSELAKLRARLEKE